MSADELDLDVIELGSNVVSDEQKTFDLLSSNDKLARLNQLVQQSQLYSQIILDNMMEKSMEKRRQQEEERAKEEAARAKAEEKAKLKAEKARLRAERKAEAAANAEIVTLSESESEPESDLESVQQKRSARRMRRQNADTFRKKRKSKSEPEEPVKRASEKTEKTKRAIEAAQTGHNQLQPALVSGCTMKDYQLDGLEWLVSLYENGLNGILADEMGLGKTLQTIALICYLMEHNVKGLFLVVAPLSTVANWVREFNRFAPEVKVVAYKGAKEDRKQISLQYKKTPVVVITSYELVVRDFARFSRVHWVYLTVDEGHRLKNFECILVQYLKRLRVGNRLLLTGTPLQNNLQELWSLLNFILPDIFHDLELFQLWFNFDEIAEAGENVNAAERKMIQKEIQVLLVKNLHAILKPFLLRRVKRDVVQGLPPKKEYIVYCSLTPLQKFLYSGCVHSKMKLTLTEVYAKEQLLYNGKKLFNKPEDFKIVDSFLDDSEAQRVLNAKRERKYRMSLDLLAKINNGYEDDLLDDEELSMARKRRRREKNAEEAKKEQPLEAKKGKTQPKTELKPEAQQSSAASEDIQDDYSMVDGWLLDPKYFDNLVYEPHLNLRQQSPRLGEAPSEFSEPKGEQSDKLDLLINDEEEKPEPQTEESEEKEMNSELSDLESENMLLCSDTVEVISESGVLTPDYHPEVIDISDEEEMPIEEQQHWKAKACVEKSVKHIRNLPLKNATMQLRTICGTHYSYYQPFQQNLKFDEQLARAAVERSGKFRTLTELLDRLLKDNHKVLVFSQFTTVLDVIAVVLEQKGIALSQLDGRVHHENREVEIARFSSTDEDSSKVFLLSTRAGGLGLNLVAADTVILFDNDWNPQIDIQAIDRVHRIGQEKPVKIFRFVVKDTVEELIVLRAMNKRVLEKMVIQLGNFHMGRMAKRLAQDNIDLDKEATLGNLLDLSKKLDLLGSGDSELTRDDCSKAFFEPNDATELTEEEWAELLDRSDECYTREMADYQNITTFESVNNMDS